MKSVVHRILSARMIPVIIWAITGFIFWYFFASSYERFLGNAVWDMFPQKEVFLNLSDHVFTIGLKIPDESTVPNLTLLGHNFGFGLIITGSIILGTRGRQWILRLVGLLFTWIALFITHIIVLVVAAHTYQNASIQPEIPLGFSIFINLVHPTVTVLPIVIALIWFVVPFNQYWDRLTLR